MKAMLGKGRAQVSIETLLLTSIIILMCLSVFSYYTQIRDTTTAIQLLKIEALRYADSQPGQFTIKKINYKVETVEPLIAIRFCILSEPAILDSGAIATIEGLIEDNTAFEEDSVEVNQLEPGDASPCE